MRLARRTSLPMLLSSICAMAPGGVIGIQGRIPWHLPRDLANFRRLTLGKPIIMGRRTFESLGRPLPRRRNLVLSRQTGWHPAGVEVCASLTEALALVRDAEEAVIIGGGQLYREALPLVQRQYLTLLQIEFPGDTFYPSLEVEEWRVAEHWLSVEDELPWSFLRLERIGHEIL